MAVYLPGGVTVVRAEGVEAAKPGGTHAGAKSQLLASKKREVTRDGKTAQEREVIKAGTDVVIELAGIDEAVKAAEAAKAAQATTRPADGASQGGWRK
jgi:hypothetical protein